MNKTIDKSKEDIWPEVYRDLRETLLGLHRKREPLPMNSKQNKSGDMNKTSEEDTNKTTDKSEEDNGDWLYKELNETSL